jgi:hypothetical protein
MLCSGIKSLLRRLTPASSTKRRLIHATWSWNFNGVHSKTPSKGTWNSSSCTPEIGNCPEEDHSERLSARSRVNQENDFFFFGSYF